MNYLEHKYLNQISFKLEKLEKVSSDTYSCRCPFCGDSKRIKSKKRGSIFNKEGNTFYHCYNCDISLPFSVFLQQIDSNVFQEYKLENVRLKSHKLKENVDDVIKKASSVNVKKLYNENYLRNCKKLKDIVESDDLYEVKEYCINRKIPEYFFDRLYACNNITDVTSTIPKYKDKVYWQDTKMLIIPFFKSDGTYDYIQCRCVGNVSSSLRYITLEINSNSIKLYGLDDIDWNQPIRILEGPIDAMFVDNSLALAGASISKAFDYISMKQIQETGKANKESVIVCYDNDYKSNKQIKNQLNNRIDEGYSVLIYDKIFTKKDMNAIILQGWGVEKLNVYITKQTFKGLRAKLELSKLNR